MSYFGQDSTMDVTAKRLRTFKMKENAHPEPATPPADPILRFSFGKAGQSTAPSSRPTSHHRRRSSVSTKRESAEIMGVSAVTLCDAADSDTANTRLRALLALEGRSSGESSSNDFVGGFAKVEIPELATPDFSQAFDSSFKTVSLLNNIAFNGKRDSFGRDKEAFGRVLTPSLSSKDQLHTLHEEEEEEEEEEEAVAVSKSPADFKAPSILADSTITNIRPLSTMMPTSSVSRTGLKPLTLATSPPIASLQGLSGTKRLLSSDQGPTRRSSISYKRSNDQASQHSSHSIIVSHNVLPTPESTPTTSERPLSPSEQAFLFSNQASLLSRIAELEMALSLRTRSASIASTSSRQLSVSSVTSEPPSDEMLRLVSDLKSERDDLTRDVAVWQTRVEDLEKQVALLNRRVENERRDAWSAREKSGLLEVETKRIQGDLTTANSHMVQLLQSLKESREVEVGALRNLEQERGLRMQAQRALASRPQLLPSSSHVDAHTARKEKGSLRLSVLSTTNHVASEVMNSQDEDELAHYEDEEDVDQDLDAYSDNSFNDSTGSSFFSPVLPARENDLLKPAHNGGAPLPSPSSASSAPPPTPSPLPQEAHKRTTSLEQNWSFPRGAQSSHRQAHEVDRFFQCLDMVDESGDELSPHDGFHAAKSIGKDKYGFFSGADDEEDEELPPFILPVQEGYATSVHALDAVSEGDEPEDMTSSTLFTDTSALQGNSSTRRDNCAVGYFELAYSRAEAPNSNLDNNFVKRETQFRTPATHPLPSPKSYPKGTIFAQTFIPAPVASPQTPRKMLAPSKTKAVGSAKPSKSPSFLATPTSIPRVKAPGGATATANNAIPRNPAQLKKTSTLSESPPSEGGFLLKSSALTALAGYLPWTWSNQGEAVPRREVVSQGSSYPRKVNDSDRARATPTQVRPRARGISNEGSTSGKRADGLVIL